MISNLHIANNCHCARLRAATRSVTRIYDELLRPVGVKGNQFTMLVATSLLQPVPISKLAEELSMERTTLTRNLAPLEKDELISIESGGGRIRNVSLTDKGAFTIEQGKPLWQEAQKQVEAKLGKSKTGALDTTLEELAEV